MNALRGWWWDGKAARKMTRMMWACGVAPAPTRGRWLIVARSWALKVDVDGQRKLSLDALADRLQKNNRRLCWLVEQRSPSGRGWHRWIGVWPRPTSAVETVALQLLCGSDPHREAYNLNRARQVDAGQVSDYWRARWNVFYRKDRERA